MFLVRPVGQLDMETESGVITPFLVGYSLSESLVLLNTEDPGSGWDFEGTLVLNGTLTTFAQSGQLSKPGLHLVSWDEAASDTMIWKQVDASTGGLRHVASISNMAERMGQALGLASEIYFDC